MSNFKKWAEQDGLDRKRPPEHVRQRVTGSMGVFELMGNMIELFIPRLFGMFKDLLGGKGSNVYKKTHARGKFEDSKPPKYPNRADTPE